MNLMHIFGPVMRRGFEVPFKPLEIEIPSASER